MSKTASGVSSAGNYSFSNRGRQTRLDLSFIPELTIDAKLKQLEHYAYYILSHNLDCRFIASEITDNLKQLPYMQRAVLFYVYGMDLSVKYAARTKLHVSTATAYRLLYEAEEAYKQILLSQQQD